LCDEAWSSAKRSGVPPPSDTRSRRCDRRPTPFSVTRVDRLRAEGIAQRNGQTEQEKNASRHDVLHNLCDCLLFMPRAGTPPPMSVMKSRLFIDLGLARISSM